MNINDTSEPLGRLALRLISNVPTIVSSFASLVVIAYITGWIQATAYFSRFNAEWLVHEMDSFYFLQFSWLPLIYLAFFIFLGIQDLEDTENDKSFHRWTLTAKILKYGLIPLLFIIILAQLLINRNESVAGVLLSISFIACIFFAGTAFEGLVIIARKKRLTWDTADLKLVVTILIFGLYFTPKLLGTLNGLRDSNERYSGLPIVEINNQSEERTRMLLIAGDNIFTYQTNKESPSGGKILIYDTSQIKAIDGRKKADPK